MSPGAQSVTAVTNYRYTGTVVGERKISYTCRCILPMEYWKGFFLWRCEPTRVMASSFLRFLDHTQRRTTVGRTPLDEWSARHRDLHLTNTQHSQQTNIHAPGGIRTHALSRRAAEDLRLRPRGYWDRQWKGILAVNLAYTTHRKIHDTSRQSPGYGIRMYTRRYFCRFVKERKLKLWYIY